jgi:hypothetical protein
MPAMDKSNYYVLQTDQMLTLYCKDAEEHGDGLLIANTIRVMDCLPSADLSDESGSDSDDNDGIESVNDNNDGDDSIQCSWRLKTAMMVMSVMMTSSKYLCYFILQSFHASCNNLILVLFFFN